MAHRRGTRLVLAGVLPSETAAWGKAYRLLGRPCRRLRAALVLLARIPSRTSL